MLKYLFSLFFALILSSCGSFIEKVQQQIASEESGGNNNSTIGNTNPYPAQAYGKLKTKRRDLMPIKDPISYTLTGDDQRPEIEQTPLRVKKRFTSSDFVDSDTTGSLWSNYDDSNSLFSTTSSRKSGDIVVIDVLETMKNSISKELRKAFPLAPLFQSNSIVSALSEENNDNKDDGKKNSAIAPGSAETKKDEVKEDTEVADIIYDKISSRVASEVNKDHVVLKGRKEVYFRNQKRLIEIHGLAKKSDIDGSDKIKSDQLIESKIFIIQ